MPCEEICPQLRPLFWLLTLSGRTWVTHHGPSKSITAFRGCSPRGDPCNSNRPSMIFTNQCHSYQFISFRGLYIDHSKAQAMHIEAAEHLWESNTYATLDASIGRYQINSKSCVCDNACRCNRRICFYMRNKIPLMVCTLYILKSIFNSSILVAVLYIIERSFTTQATCISSFVMRVCSKPNLNKINLLKKNKRIFMFHNLSR